MKRLLVSFGGAALLLGAFVVLLDPSRLAARLVDAHLPTFAVGLVAVVAAMGCWSEASRLLFRSFGADLSRWRAFVAYGAGAFGKQVLPMGNAGGPAVMAYAFEREVGLGYSRSLAVIAVAEFCSLSASVLLALVGIGALLSVGTTGGGLRLLGVGVLLVAAALVALGVVVWSQRTAVRAGVTALVRGLQPPVGRVSTRLAARLDPGRVTAGLDRYYETFDEVVADRRTLAVAFLLTQLGWFCFAVPLYTGALALGVDLPLALAFFLVPAVGVATVVPLPGGLGGIELALAGLLTGLAGVELTVAGAIVVLFRLCSFWFFTLVGGLSVLLSTARAGDLPTALDEPAAALEPAEAGVDD